LSESGYLIEAAVGYMSFHVRAYCAPVPIHATVPTDSAEV